MPTAKPVPAPELSVLDLLRQAKMESDRRNWAAKHALLRQAMQNREGEFKVDSQPNSFVLGLTHNPSGFRIHAPVNIVSQSLLDSFRKAAELSVWQKIGERARAFARLGEANYRHLHDWLSKDQANGDYGWVCPIKKEAWVFTDKLCPVLEVHRLKPDEVPPDFDKQPWIPVKAANALRPLFSAAQLVPNRFNALFGGATPAASMLAGGLLGAGLGYGGGYLAEKLVGDKYLEPGRLRRTASLLGGLLGATPGAYLGTLGMRTQEEGKNPWSAWVQPNPIFGERRASFDEAEEDLNEHLGELKINPTYLKSADDAGGLYLRSIPVDAFQRTLWEDPNTPMNVKAIAANLVESASQNAGGVNFISPMDIGKIASGAGSGLASAALVGKTLGVLAGLTPQAQNTLMQTGAWAGALLNVVPKAFGF